MVFYSIEIFRIASLGILTQKYMKYTHCTLTDHINYVVIHFRTDFNSVSKFKIVEGADRYQKRFREHEKLFLGASRKQFREPGEKGQISKELGTPLMGSL